MRIYLAGPIDLSNGDLLTRSWRWFAKEAIKRMECDYYDPSEAYYPGFADAKAIWEGNQQALVDCDTVLALLPPSVRTIGTPMEIEHARMIGKPVAVICEDISFQLQGANIPQFDFKDLEIAIEILKAEAPSPVGIFGVEVKSPEVYDKIFFTGQGMRPEQGLEGDAGFDLFVETGQTILVNETVNVPHGIRVEFPPTMWGLIVGRSSAMRKRGLMVSQAVIDSGYRGDLFTVVTNLSGQVLTVEEGERISQIIPFDLTSSKVSFEYVNALGISVRGHDGFGSTGL